MTQAQFAGGTANAPQAHPVKGQLIRDFTLPSTVGREISVSDYRGRSSLVLVFAGGSIGKPDLKILTEISTDYARFREEQAEVLAILQCDWDCATKIAQQANFSFPLLVDDDGRVHRSAGAVDNEGGPSAVIYIVDSFGEVFAVYEAADGQAMPKTSEIAQWLTLISMQCPECGHPEW